MFSEIYGRSFSCKFLACLIKGLFRIYIYYVNCISINQRLHNLITGFVNNWYYYSDLLTTKDNLPVEKPVENVNNFLNINYPWLLM